MLSQETFLSFAEICVYQEEMWIQICDNFQIGLSTVCLNCPWFQTKVFYEQFVGLQFLCFLGWLDEFSTACCHKPSNPFWLVSLIILLTSSTHLQQYARSELLFCNTSNKMSICEKHKQNRLIENMFQGWSRTECIS